VYEDVDGLFTSAYSAGGAYNQVSQSSHPIHPPSTSPPPPPPLHPSPSPTPLAPVKGLPLFSPIIVLLALPLPASTTLDLALSSPSISSTLPLFSFVFVSRSAVVYCTQSSRSSEPRSRS
jgi:hypothetical protein